MSDEPRALQAADVYNATHDLPLYEWVASLESQNQALQEERDTLLGRIAEATGYASKLSPLSDEQGLILPKLRNALSPTQETDPE